MSSASDSSLGYTRRDCSAAEVPSDETCWICDEMCKTPRERVVLSVNQDDGRSGQSLFVSTILLFQVLHNQSSPNHNSTLILYQ